MDMDAKNPYEYHKLETAKFYFVPCTVEETYDELIFTYDLELLYPFSHARTMRNPEKYGFLLQILESISSSSEYKFSLHPENIYLDAQNRIRILERDLRHEGEGTEDAILEDIRALAGYLLQKKYSFENFKEGGTVLLKKQSTTRYLLEIDNQENAIEVLRTLQKEEREKDQERLLYVNKKGYRSSLWMLGLAVTGCVCMTAVLIYQNHWVIKREASALMAERAYMEQDFPAVMDALAGIPLEQMDRHEKYLLAVVSIRGQSVDSFQAETKERLLSKLSYDGDEHLLDYWISLGRMDADQALDIAMRMSDYQLTLYAYLQKMDLISADNLMPGEEKVQQVESLKEKVKNLANELGIEYQEK